MPNRNSKSRSTVSRSTRSTQQQQQNEPLAQQQQVPRTSSKITAQQPHQQHQLDRITRSILIDGFHDIRTISPTLQDGVRVLRNRSVRLQPPSTPPTMRQSSRRKASDEKKMHSKITVAPLVVVKTEPVSDDEVDHTPEAKRPSVQSSALVVHSAQSFLESLCSRRSHSVPQGVPNNVDAFDKVTISLPSVVSRSSVATRYLVDRCRHLSCKTFVRNALRMCAGLGSPHKLSSFLSTRSSDSCQPADLSLRWSPGSSTYLQRHASPPSTMSRITQPVALPQIEFATAVDQRRSIVRRRSTVYLHESQISMDTLPPIILTEQTVAFDVQPTYADTAKAATPMRSIGSRVNLESIAPSTSSSAYHIAARSYSTTSSIAAPVCKSRPVPDQDDSESTLSACEEFEQSPTKSTPLLRTALASTSKTRFLDTLQIPDGITIISAADKRDSTAAARHADASPPVVIFSVQPKQKRSWDRAIGGESALRTPFVTETATSAIPTSSIFNFTSAFVTNSTTNCVSTSSALPEYLQSSSSISIARSAVGGMSRVPAHQRTTPAHVSPKVLLFSSGPSSSAFASQPPQSNKLVVNSKIKDISLSGMTKNQHGVNILRRNGHKDTKTITVSASSDAMIVTGPNVTVQRMASTSGLQPQQPASRMHVTSRRSKTRTRKTLLDTKFSPSSTTVIPSRSSAIPSTSHSTEVALTNTVSISMVTVSKHERNKKHTQLPTPPAAQVSLPATASRPDLPLVSDVCADCCEQNLDQTFDPRIVSLLPISSMQPFKRPTMFAAAESELQRMCFSATSIDAWTQLLEEDISLELHGPMAFTVPGRIKPMLRGRTRLRQVLQSAALRKMWSSTALPAPPLSLTSASWRLTQQSSDHTASAVDAVTSASAPYIGPYTQHLNFVAPQLLEPAGRLPAANVHVQLSTQNMSRFSAGTNLRGVPPLTVSYASHVSISAPASSTMDYATTVAQADAIRSIGVYLRQGGIGDSPAAIGAVWSMVATAYNCQRDHRSRDSSPGCNVMLTTAIADSQYQNERFGDLMEIVADERRRGQSWAAAASDQHVKDFAPNDQPQNNQRARRPMSMRVKTKPSYKLVNMLRNHEAQQPPDVDGQLPSQSIAGKRQWARCVSPVFPESPLSVFSSPEHELMPSAKRTQRAVLVAPLPDDIENIPMGQLFKPDIGFDIGAFMLDLDMSFEDI